MPYKPEERQYRSFAASNFQPIKRDGEDDGPSYRVKGYWTTFGQEYLLYERVGYWPAEYEQIDAHALDEADMSDVIFQENHRDSPLARQRNGSLELGVDMHGAWCIADLGGCQRGRDLYEAITNGLVDEMSFGFIIDTTNESDGYTTYKDEQGDYHTTITRIRSVYDVSAVTTGANPNTEIAELRKRSYISELTEADMLQRKRDAEEAEEAKRPAEEERAEEPEAEEAEQVEDDTATEETVDEPADEQESEPTEDEIKQAFERRKARLRLRARALQLKTL